MHSSVIILTRTKASDLTIGADVTVDLKKVLPFVANQFETVVIDSDLFKFKSMCSILQNIEAQSPHTQKIISASSLTTPQILQLLNQFEIFKILTTWDKNILEKIIMESKEAFYQLKQSDDLIHLHKEQNTKLQDFRNNLEKRIQKRQSSLEIAKKKALESSHQLKTLVKVIVQVQLANNFKEIEKSITDILSDFMQLEETQIMLNRPDLLEDDKIYNHTTLSDHQYIVNLDISGYSAFILYKKRGKFTLSEKKILRQISEAVILTINRILGREQTEALKKQWEDTFYAIMYPIAIIDNDFNILQFNKSINKQSNQKKCFQILFNRDTPCKGCKMKQAEDNFKISSSKQHIEVLSKKFSDHPVSYVNVYKDITEETVLEKQILENAKTSELGLVGSSIAHELNNPLSGIMTLLQVIAEELPDKNPHKDDIIQMQKATENCLNIISHLLSFSRKPSLIQSSSIDIRDLTEKIIHLTELKTKPYGVHISMTSEGDRHIFHFKTKDIQHLLTQFLNMIADTTLQNIGIRLKEENLQKTDTSQVLKNSPQILIALHSKASVYKVIASVFLEKDRPMLSDRHINDLSNLLAPLDGNLTLTPYDGTKSQAQLLIPFTKGAIKSALKSKSFKK